MSQTKEETLGPWPTKKITSLVRQNHWDNNAIQSIRNSLKKECSSKTNNHSRLEQ